MIALSAAVREAVRAGAPIVALESTIISHGLPWPDNAQAARSIEAAVASRGAVPATIAVLGGRPTIGLDDAALERLARPGGGAAKCSTRELALVAARGGDGATTVAATLHLARRAGVRVFATGGLGGVHRGGEASLDVSADLPALARASGTVTVCAGVKSILDIGRTLEVGSRGSRRVGDDAEALSLALSLSRCSRRSA